MARPFLQSLMAAAQGSRASEISSNLSAIRSSVLQAVSESTIQRRSIPVLVAVSKLKPVEDIRYCYDSGHRDFGENYVQECIEKANELPDDIRWHFIGPLQSNKAKNLAALPNLYAFHTLSSTKVADLLSKHLSKDRSTPLKVFIQINTSSEDSKSGISIDEGLSDTSPSEAALLNLCHHVIHQCPGLYLMGLMTIGSLGESTSGGENKDFQRLNNARTFLEEKLSPDEQWGEMSILSGTERRVLLLSMGMSSDYEEAIRQGADFVRVGSSIFGARQPKDT